MRTKKKRYVVAFATPTDDGARWFTAPAVSPQVAAALAAQEALVYGYRAKTVHVYRPGWSGVWDPEAALWVGAVDFRVSPGRIIIEVSSDDSQNDDETGPLPGCGGWPLL